MSNRTFTSKYRIGLSLSMVGLLLSFRAPHVYSWFLPVAQAVTTVGGTSTFTPNTPTIGPTPAFQFAQQQSFSNLYSSCFPTASSLDPLVNAIVSATSGTSDTKVTGCSAVPAKNCTMVVPNTRPDCPKTSDGAFDDKTFDGYITKATASACCASAKVGALHEAQKELSCISSQEDMLANEVKSLESSFQQELQQAQQNISTVDGYIKDRANQKDTIQKMLGGDKNNPGTNGLVALQQKFEQMVQSDLPTKTQALENVVNDAKSGYFAQQSNLLQLVQNAEMGRAKQCVNETPSGLCWANKTQMCSFSQQLLNMYYGKIRNVGNDSSRMYDTVSQQDAKRKMAQLQSLLSQIYANISNETDLAPSTADDIKKQNLQPGQHYSVGTPQSLEALYGNQLKTFNLPGLNVHDLFVNKFESCFEQAIPDVAASGDSRSQYSLANATMSSWKKQITDQFKVYYQTYGNLYAKFWSTVGQHAPLDFTKCNSDSTSLTGKLQCAHDLSDNLTAIYNGTGSPVNIPITGQQTNPPTSFVVSCYGINGCVTSLQNTVRNIGTEEQRLDTVKLNQVNQANQNIDKFKAQMTQMLSIQSNALQQRIGTLKAVLAANGVEQPLSITPLEAKQLEKSKYKDSQGNTVDGLYKDPGADILAVIGGGLTPPLPDPSAHDFDNVSGSVTSKVNEYMGKAQDIEQAIQALQKEKAQCGKKIAKGIVNDINSQLNNLVSLCSDNSDMCDSSSDTSLTSLTAALTQLNMTSDSQVQLMMSALRKGTNQCVNDGSDLSQKQAQFSTQFPQGCNVACPQGPSQAGCAANNLNCQTLFNQIEALKRKAGNSTDCTMLAGQVKQKIQDASAVLNPDASGASAH